jgi:hypothetical protein
MPSDIPKDMTFDVRILERNVRKNLISSKDLDKHLAELKDRTEGGVTIEARMDHTAQVPGNVAPISAARKREEEEELD